MSQENNSIKGWQRILILIPPYFLFVGGFQLVGYFVSGADIENIENTSFLLTSEQRLITLFFNLVSTLCLVWFLMKVIDDEPFIQLGLHLKNRLNNIILGLLLGFLIMLLGGLIIYYFDDLQFYKLNYDVNEIILSIVLFTIVAIVEEVLFRGYILRNLMYSFNKYFALFLSSVLFSLMHGANPNMDWFSFLNLFLAGILLGVSYIYTKNLWFPIALHFSWNFFQTLFGFNVSGQDFYSLIEFRISEKNILNGGNFGFEGSILSIIVQVILILTVIIYYQNKKIKVQT